VLDIALHREQQAYAFVPQAVQVGLESGSAIFTVEVLPRPGAGVLHRGTGFRGCRLEDDDRARLKAGIPRCGIDEDLLRRERPEDGKLRLRFDVAHGAPRLEGVGDLVEMVVAFGFHPLVEADRTAGQIFAQRLGPAVEQRQPVLHAGQPPALPDRLEQRVAAVRAAELVLIVRLEVLHAVVGQDDFGHRRQLEALQFGSVAGATAYGVQVSVDQLQAEPTGGARSDQVDAIVIPQEVAGSLHGVGGRIAVAQQEQPQRLLDLVTRFRVKSRCFQYALGRQAAQEGMRRGQHESGTLRRLAQLQQGVDPPGGHRGGGRTPVVWRAIPCDQGHDLQVGRKEGQGAPDPDQPPMIPDNVQQAGSTSMPGKPGQQYRIEPFRRAREDSAPRLCRVKIQIHGLGKSAIISKGRVQPWSVGGNRPSSRSFPHYALPENSG
jgi:hypothetical protein